MYAHSRILYPDALLPLLILSGMCSAWVRIHTIARQAVAGGCAVVAAGRQRSGGIARRATGVV
jgi:hypothetical protein